MRHAFVAPDSTRRAYATGPQVDRQMIPDDPCRRGGVPALRLVNHGRSRRACGINSIPEAHAGPMVNTSADEAAVLPRACGHPPGDGKCCHVAGSDGVDSSVIQPSSGLRLPRPYYWGSSWSVRAQCLESSFNRRGSDPLTSRRTGKDRHAFVIQRSPRATEAFPQNPVKAQFELVGRCKVYPPPSR